MHATLLRRTPFGPVAIAWEPGPRGPVAALICLSGSSGSADRLLRAAYPDADIASCREIDALAGLVLAMLAGEPVVFPLDRVALESCPPFQQAVLRADARIPRGQVRTYGEIAAQVGKPGAARAVGNALANNPFPLVVPCHRVVLAGGRLGGFGGGAALKRALLALEGVETDPDGRVRAFSPARDEIHPRQPPGDSASCPSISRSSP